MIESTLIKAEQDTNIFVDAWDEGGVWLSIQHRFGSAHATLTKKQAQEMIAALQAIVGEQE